MSEKSGDVSAEQENQDKTGVSASDDRAGQQDDSYESQYVNDGTSYEVVKRLPREQVTLAWFSLGPKTQKHRKRPTASNDKPGLR